MASFPAHSPAAAPAGAVSPARCAEPVIELDDVSLGWRGRIAVRGVSGTFRRGSLTAVVGPNGAGKSTLLKGIVGLLNPLKGHIRLADDPRRDLAFLPQANE